MEAPFGERRHARQGKGDVLVAAVEEGVQPVQNPGTATRPRVADAQASLIAIALYAARWRFPAMHARARANPAKASRVAVPPKDENGAARRATPPYAHPWSLTWRLQGKGDVLVAAIAGGSPCETPGTATRPAWQTRKRL